MKVIDIINANAPEIEVKIQGCNPTDDCDPWVETYFKGSVNDVPENLRDCEVIRKGWSLGSCCHAIYVPYITKKVVR